MTERRLLLASVGAALLAAVLIQMQNIQVGYQTPFPMLTTPLWPIGLAPIVVLAAALFGRRRGAILLAGHLAMMALLFWPGVVHLGMPLLLGAFVVGASGALAAILALTRFDA